MNTNPLLNRGDSSIQNFLRMLRPILDEKELIGQRIKATELAKICRNYQRRLPIINRRAQELAEQLKSLAGGGDTFTFDDLDISVYMEVDPGTRRISPEIEFQLSVSLEQQYLNSKRGYFQRCALEVQIEVNVYHLFTTFCQDSVIKTIVERAKSILRCSDDYFSATSPYTRVNGIEMHERLARVFVEKMVLSRPGEVMLVGLAYERFSFLAKEKDLAPIKRCVFREMMKPLIRERFGTCLRNDLVVNDRYCQGWKDLELRAWD